MKRMHTLTIQPRRWLGCLVALALAGCDDAWRQVNSDSIPGPLLREFGWLSSVEFPDATIRIAEDGRIDWVGGTWTDGVWPNGIWSGGIWNDGVWNEGEWRNGTWKGGKWRDGVWHKGTWRNGTWYGGTWRNGVWRNGVWQNGTWKRGVWYNGVWEDGVWEDGVWVGGTWRSGTWKGGRCDAIPSSGCPESINERQQLIQAKQERQRAAAEEQGREILRRIQEEEAQAQ